MLLMDVKVNFLKAQIQFCMQLFFPPFHSDIYLLPLIFHSDIYPHSFFTRSPSSSFCSDPNCVHVQPGTGRLQAQFDIYLNSCGMTSTSSPANYGQPTPSGTYIENTVIIQYDPLVQEVRKEGGSCGCFCLHNMSS